MGLLFENMVVRDLRVYTEERNKLSFLAVITGDGYAYTDVSNGQRIHMIPIGCLRN